jgi:hypothetical protein
MRSGDARDTTEDDAEFREGAVRIVRETGKPIAQVARDARHHTADLPPETSTRLLRRSDDREAVP